MMTLVCRSMRRWTLLALACTGPLCVPAAQACNGDIDGSSTIDTDATGAVVKIWTGATFGASAGYLRPDGSLVRPCWYTAGTFNAGGRGGRVQIFNPAGTLVNDLIAATSQYQQHHDLAMMPNGDILCIVWEQHTQAEGKAAGRTTLNNVIWSETIMQIRPTGDSTFQTV